MNIMKKIYQALLLTFILSWGLVALADSLGIGYTSGSGMILAITYMFMPTISLTILSKLFWREKIPGVLKPKGKIFFLAWFWPILLAIATILVTTLIPGVTFSPGMEGIIGRYGDSFSPEQLSAMRSQIASIGFMMPIIMIVQALLAGITINAIAAFGEEGMWRGFLLKELKGLGWIRASIVIGAIWGAWHAPLIIQGHNYPEHPQIGVVMMIIWCILLTPPLIYFTVRTGSVITAAIMHGTLNGICGIAMAYFIGGNDLLVGMTGLAGFIAIAIFDLLLFVYDKKQGGKVSSDLSKLWE
jgi:membrane protease YdiL (CAAX protease family)